MSTSKKPETAPAARPTRSASSTADRPAIAIPRSWFVALVGVLLVPWLVAAVLYVRNTDGVAAAPAPAVAADPSSPSDPGPWGQLTLTPILVSPPLEYVAGDWGRSEHAGPWYFPAASRELVGSFLSSVGVPQDAVTRLLASAREDGSIRGLVIEPEPVVVRALAPDVRARLYEQMGKSALNFDQANPFRFLGTSPEAWLRGSLISAATRALVEPLIYRDGDFLQFADGALVRSEITDPEELRRLAKALLRQSTLLVRLSVTDLAQVSSLADYWGRGGRRTDVRPLLESVAGGGADSDRTIDVVHLLPSFARNHLYRYPRVTTGDLDKPLLANCLWSSLNFFSEVPDDRFLDVDTALATLKRDYHIVEHGFQLGDIVAFLDGDGDLFHVAVYLADGLVFTKNGMSPVAPWTIMPIERLTGYYRGRANERRMIYHRRNDL